jgi:hypothetical protein
MADQTEELSRSKMQEMVVDYIAKKPENREALLADPRRVLSDLVDQPIPEGLNVRVVEETADTIFLIVPCRPEELSDRQLEDVAGGAVLSQAAAEAAASGSDDAAKYAAADAFDESAGSGTSPGGAEDSGSSLFRQVVQPDGLAPFSWYRW